MTREEIEDLCELNPEQAKAFKKLERAYKDCLKKEIYFHQVLETLHAFNGNNVKEIDDTDPDGNSLLDSPFCTQSLYQPCMQITDGWADDNHFVHLK